MPESAQSLIIADSSSGEKGSVSSIRLTTSQTILASACGGKEQAVTQTLPAEQGARDFRNGSPKCQEQRGCVSWDGALGSTPYDPAERAKSRTEQGGRTERGYLFVQFTSCQHMFLLSRQTGQHCPCAELLGNRRKFIHVQVYFKRLGKRCLSCNDTRFHRERK